MKFLYEDLSPEQFEDVVIAVCENILGMGVQGFATGPDGGRDGRFEGTADEHPSKNGPWIGKTVIQAKHTNGLNKGFGDSDFFSPGSVSTVMHEEVPKIRKLREAGELDHYILFSNRRLTAGVEQKLRDHISAECDIPSGSLYIVGTERLERYLKSYPGAADGVDLRPAATPLIIQPDDLAEVVEAIADVWDASAGFTAPEDRISYELKNELNDVDPEYAKVWRERYLKHTRQIQEFLADTKNAHIRGRYEDTAEEIQMKVFAEAPGEGFAKLIEYVIDLLFNRDPVLRSNKPLTRAVVFFMYWSCDIGKKSDAEAS